MTLESRRIRERISQAERDLVEVDDQHAHGEIDAATAERLRARYRRERGELIEQLAGDAAEVAEELPKPGLITGRRMAGAAVIMVAAAVLAFGVVRAVDDAAPGAEGIASDVAAGEEVNLDNITNEQMEEVIAQNPDVAPMRLALADRYFAAGEFSDALAHYMYVLEEMGIDDPEALANVGWMTYLSDVPDVAASFVERSIRIEPDAGIAFWYLANIRYRGLNDAPGAIEPLRQLLGYENLPTELRTEAESLLAEVEALS